MYLFFSFRYAGPYDYNRVVLKEVINGQDYIDASQISDSGNIVIATQCPLQTTIAHFLQMLTDQKIDSIVMLTKTYEQRPGNTFKGLKLISSSIRLKSIFFFCRTTI